MWGEQIYGLDAKALAGGGRLQMIHEVVTQQQLLANFGIVAYQVPDDSVMVLQNVQVTGIGGGAQVVDWLDFGASYHGLLLPIYPIAREQKNQALEFLNWNGLLLLEPRAWIIATGNFSAAAIPNEIRCYVHGYLIPRGTFAVG